jgi:hypothetical protein
MKTLRTTLILCLLAFTNILFAQQWPGLTLVGTSSGAALKLVDTAGTTIKTINCTGGNSVYSNYLMKGGYFWRTLKQPSGVTGLSGGGMHGRIQKYDWNGNLLWEYTHADPTYHMHHDHCPLPNGNVLVISYETKTSAEIVAAGGTYNATAWFEKIMEIQPTGLNTQNIVWEWHLWDHICQKADPNKPNYVSSTLDNPQLWDIGKVASKDFAHMNGIDYDSVRNQVIFSCHFTNEFYIVDRGTTTAEAAGHTGGTMGKGGDFLYRYGKPSNYGSTAATAISTLHDAHVVKVGPLKDYVGFFHNDATSSASAIDYVQLPRSGNGYTITPGSAFTPTTYTKRFSPSINSNNMSSCEEFPNGNIMVASALQSTIKEIDSTGAIIWTYAAGGTIPQAHRFDMCKISLNPPTTPNIVQTGQELTVPNVPGYTYQWLYNGNSVGTTNNVTAGTNYGLYTLIVTDSFYCSSPQAAIGYYPTGIETIVHNKFNFYPNPSQGVLNIEAIEGAKYLQVIDATGRVKLTTKFTTTLWVNDMPNGNYFLRVLDDKKVLGEQQFILAQ